ncbi:MAG: hypothetical protein ACKOKC_17480 [Chthoniobacterales bacterium]
MNIAHALRIFAFTALAVLPGCLATQSGSLEVLNPKQAYGRSLTVAQDVHRENEAIEKRLASDLQAALAKRGLTVAEDPAKADLVVVPTLGRMRERAPAPVAPVEQAAPVEASEPVIAAPAPEARGFNRFSANAARSRADISAPRSIPSARIPAAAQQAGLLLTAYRAEDYGDYGIGRQSLPPIWRIYVSQPAMQMKWNSVAVPLINAAASAAMPLGKVQNEERKVKNEEPAAEQPESRVTSGESRNKKKRPKDEEPERSGTADGPKANSARQSRGQTNKEDDKKKGSVFRFFGRSVEKPESAAAGNRNQATGDRRE